jgi:hypothetical protein
MLSTLAGPAGNETRRSIVIVWLTISAVWLSFWALIAALALAAAEIRQPFLGDLLSLSLFVICPPLAIFGLAVVARLALGLFMRPAARTNSLR